MEKRRPKGVTILAFISIVGSLGNILGVLTLKGRLLTYQETHFALPDSYYSVVLFHDVFFAIAGLVVGIALFKLLKWARFLAIANIIIGLTYGVVFYFVYTRPYIIPYFIKTSRPTFIFYIFYIIGVLVAIVIIYYLTRPKVKEMFR